MSGAASEKRNVNAPKQRYILKSIMLGVQMSVLGITVILVEIGLSVILHLNNLGVKLDGRATVL